MGPQTTGLLLGKEAIISPCYTLSNPNVSIGRPYKVGKEEYAALYMAIKNLVEADEEQVKRIQNQHLDFIQAGLEDYSGIKMKKVQHGRLNQDAPMLMIELPGNKTSRECADYLYFRCDPAIDINCCRPDDPAGSANRIFINSINLRAYELPHIVRSLKRFLA